MARNKTTTSAAKPSGSATSAEASEAQKPRTKYAKPDAPRETMESLVVAFILAFLFKTFEAEAFVIPTGSMAETLNGRHKEVDCEQCGWHYNIGASQEVNDEGNVFIPSERKRASICPNCRFQNDVELLPVFHGDRILVNKFPYEISDPRRWDVIVFKFPEEPQRNYIKRLIGLPGEFLKIERGDIYSRKDTREEWQILRKSDPDKQLGLQMIVYDDMHPERLLQKNGWPQRWSPIENAGWEQDSETRVYSVSAGNAAEWLRYRNFVPSSSDWEAILSDPPLPFEEPPRPQLVSDFCGYNATDQHEPFAMTMQSVDNLWVGDLTLQFDLELKTVGEGSEVLVELREGVRDYRCVIDPNSGRATLQYIDHMLSTDGEIGIAETSLQGPGDYHVTFANVDDRLCLWIDGELVAFEGGGEYDPPGSGSPTERDLEPAGVALKGAEGTVSGLKLLRDIYYRAEKLNVSGGHENEYSPYRSNGNGGGTGQSLQRLLYDPTAYGSEYLNRAQPVEFEQLADDEYFVLGDNSPASRDSRLWIETHAVPRSAVIGKAFFIYWPHGIPFMNGGEGYPVTYHKYYDHASNGYVQDKSYPNLRFPFFPNVSRMERIR